MVDVVKMFRDFESAPLVPLNLLSNEIGIYWLADHSGRRRYIGITDRLGFNQRINRYHAAGDETNSHKFSCNYNIGRMFRDAKDRSHDASLAKKLRRHFIRRYCTAACLPLTMAKNELEFIERRFIAMARPEDVLWNDSRSRSASFGEPEDLVSALIDELGWSEADRVCLERQKSRSSMSGN